MKTNRLSIGRGGALKCIGVVTAFLFSTFGVFAKAYYAGEMEMIQGSEVITIVNVTQVEQTSTVGKVWSYRQRAHATVERMIKGELPSKITLHGEESFICAQVRFKPGRHLVFLRRDGKLLVGSNWQFSVRPINETKVEWYVPGERLQLSWQPLAEVLERIASIVKKPE